MAELSSSEESRSGFRGVYNILATPFDGDRRVDRASLRRLVGAMRRVGVDGITILGVAGEAHKLTPAERSAVTFAALDAAEGTLPVIVGVSHDRTEDVIAAATEAASAGAAGVMIAPPRGSVAGTALTDHYRRVADAIEIHIVLQDYPAVTGVDLTAEDTARLVSDVPAITTIKLESLPTPQRTAETIALLDHRTTVLGGMGGVYFLEELKHGASGTMTGFSYTEILIRIWRDWQSGNEQAASATYRRYLPILQFEGQSGVGLAIRKESLRRRGFIEHAVLRPPGEAIDDATAAELSAITSRLELAATFDGDPA